MSNHYLVEGKAIAVQPGFIRTARLRDEYYDFVADPKALLEAFLKQRSSLGRPDLLTFTQDVTSPEPRFNFFLTWDEAAVLNLTTYDHWWKKQVNDKTRNMVRKAGKAGVEIKTVEFNDDLVRGIEVLYNESPLRQGRRFRHYGKKFPQIKEEHASFLERSDFIGAFFQGQLIGFVKLVHGQGVSNLMNIISLISHRDKAPTNALLAKAVEICAGRGVPRLHYGTWSRRTMGDFKKHHAFELVRVPRYYLTLSAKGRLALKFNLHIPLEDRLPENWIDKLADLRAKWNGYRFRDTANAADRRPIQPVTPGTSPVAGRT